MSDRWGLIVLLALIALCAIGMVWDET